MEIKFDERNEATFGEVAGQYGVDSKKLKALYCEIMYSNFYQDLCDIANENEEYLKGE